MPDRPDGSVIKGLCATRYWACSAFDDRSPVLGLPSARGSSPVTSPPGTPPGSPADTSHHKSSASHQPGRIFTLLAVSVAAPTRRWLRAIAAHPAPRDRCLPCCRSTPGCASPRLQRDLDDIAPSARKGTLRVRGNGATVPDLPVHPQLRRPGALARRTPQLAQRRHQPGAAAQPPRRSTSFSRSPATPDSATASPPTSAGGAVSAGNGAVVVMVSVAAEPRGQAPELAASCSHAGVFGRASWNQVAAGGCPH